MSILSKLLAIQQELKAPKNQRNNFGNYNYRSAEDILEAVKPLLLKHNVVLKVTERTEVKGEMHELVSTVKLMDVEDPSLAIETDASAYIDFNSKGQQKPQQTGSASSYAKKYALGNLFLLDDTKDSDATNTHNKAAKETLNKKHPKWDAVYDHVKKTKSLSKPLSSFNIEASALQELKSLI